MADFNSTYKGATPLLDIPANLPDQTDETLPGQNDGTAYRASHINDLKEIALVTQNYNGDDTNQPAGSVRDILKIGPENAHAKWIRSSELTSGFPTFVPGIGYIAILDDSGDKEYFIRDPQNNLIQLTKDGTLAGAGVKESVDVFETVNVTDPAYPPASTSTQRNTTLNITANIANAPPNDYEQIWPETGTSLPFTITNSGTFLVYFTLPMFASSSTTCQYRLVFDIAGTPIIVGGDSSWSRRVNSYYESTFISEVTFPVAGAHTVTGEGGEDTYKGSGGTMQIIGSSGAPMSGPLLKLVQK